MHVTHPGGKRKRREEILKKRRKRTSEVRPPVLTSGAAIRRIQLQATQAAHQAPSLLD